MLCQLEDLAKQMESLLPGLRQWHGPQVETEACKHAHLHEECLKASVTPNASQTHSLLSLLSNFHLEFLSLLSRLDFTSQNSQSKVCKT